jgi:hypothetical protein
MDQIPRPCGRNSENACLQIRARSDAGFAASQSIGTDHADPNEGSFSHVLSASVVKSFLSLSESVNRPDPSRSIRRLGCKNSVPR